MLPPRLMVDRVRTNLSGSGAPAAKVVDAPGVEPGSFAPALTASTCLTASTSRFRSGNHSGCERHDGLGIGRPELRQNRIRLGDTHRHSKLLTSVTIARDVGI